MPKSHVTISNVDLLAVDGNLNEIFIETRTTNSRICNIDLCFSAVFLPPKTGVKIEKRDMAFHTKFPLRLSTVYFQLHFHQDIGIREALSSAFEVNLSVTARLPERRSTEESSHALNQG